MSELGQIGNLRSPLPVDQDETAAAAADAPAAQGAACEAPIVRGSAPGRPDPAALFRNVREQAGEFAAAAQRWREHVADPLASTLAHALDGVSRQIEDAARSLEKTLTGFINPPPAPQPGKISAGWAAVPAAPATQGPATDATDTAPTSDATDAAPATQGPDASPDAGSIADVSQGAPALTDLAPPDAPPAALIPVPPAPEDTLPGFATQGAPAVTDDASTPAVSQDNAATDASAPAVGQDDGSTTDAAPAATAPDVAQDDASPAATDDASAPAVSQDAGSIADVSQGAPALTDLAPPDAPPAALLPVPPAPEDTLPGIATQDAPATDDASAPAVSQDDAATDASAPAVGQDDGSTTDAAPAGTPPDVAQDDAAATDASAPAVSQDDASVPVSQDAPAVDSTSTHVVRPGDTMWAIAEQHGVSLPALEAANPQIANPSLIFPGQRINVPGEAPATPPAPPSSPVTPPASSVTPPASPVTIPAPRPVATPAPAPRPITAPPAPRPIATPAPAPRPINTPAPAPRPIAVPPAPRPIATPAPAPRPVATPTPAPRPIATPLPAPRPIATPTPAPRPVTTPISEPRPITTPRPIATPAPRPVSTPAPAPRPVITPPAPRPINAPAPRPIGGTTTGPRPISSPIQPPRPIGTPSVGPRIGADLPASYTVRPGDTMWAIAAAHGVSLAALEAANPQIANPSLIHPGDAIRLPGGAPIARPAPTPAPVATPPAPSSGGGTTTYTVRPGDSLYAIAQRNGIYMADITAANPQITNPSLIYPGQVIQIPARGSGSGPSTFTTTRVSEPGIGSVSGATPPAGTTDARVMQWKPQIEAAAQKYGVSPALIAATIEWESGGNPNALSFDGGHGKGLMQIDDRWHAFARQPNALDPAANIDYGTSMIASDLKSFPGNLRAGIAAYNAGVGGVQGALSRGEDPSKATYSPGYIDGIQSSMNRFQQYF